MSERAVAVGVGTEMPSSEEPPGSAIDLPVIVGKNLRRLRTRRGHSLERLARLSGVSRAMLGQIETGKSVPTISLLWKVATALGVPFATLIAAQELQGTVVLPRDRAKVLSSSDGQFTSRALFPFDSERQVEFYELRLAAHHRENAEAHAPGTRENLIVAAGAVEIAVGKDRPHTLTEGDAILFEADVPQSRLDRGGALSRHDLCRSNRLNASGVGARAKGRHRAGPVCCRASVVRLSSWSPAYTSSPCRRTPSSWACPCSSCSSCARSTP